MKPSKKVEIKATPPKLPQKTPPKTPVPEKDAPKGKAPPRKKSKKSVGKEQIKQKSKKTKTSKKSKKSKSGKPQKQEKKTVTTKKPDEKKKVKKSESSQSDTETAKKKENVAEPDLQKKPPKNEQFLGKIAPPENKTKIEEQLLVFIEPENPNVFVEQPKSVPPPAQDTQVPNPRVRLVIVTEPDKSPRPKKPLVSWLPQDTDTSESTRTKSDNKKERFKLALPSNVADNTAKPTVPVESPKTAENAENNENDKTAASTNCQKGGIFAVLDHQYDAQNPTFRPELMKEVIDYDMTNPTLRPQDMKNMLDYDPQNPTFRPQLMKEVLDYDMRNATFRPDVMQFSWYKRASQTSNVTVDPQKKPQALNSTDEKDEGAHGGKEVVICLNDSLDEDSNPPRPRKGNSSAVDKATEVTAKTDSSTDTPDDEFELHEDKNIPPKKVT